LLAGLGESEVRRMNQKLKPLTLPLLALIAFNMVPNFWLKPLWSTALISIFLGYRTFVEFYGLRVPPRGVVWFAGAAVGGAIWMHYRSIFGDEAAGTLLGLLTCLKTYELRFKRDYFFNSLLCFLVLMSYLLVDQSLTLTLFMGIDVLLIISFLQALEAESFNWRAWRKILSPSLGMVLRAAPLLVTCFILFPRFSTGFGTGEQKQAHTGVSDKLRPGSVSSLQTSEEVIFRATFLKGFVPPARTLYWRGAVLDESRGLDWSRSSQTARAEAPPAAGDSPDIEIFLEPGSEKFLFSLENTRTLSIPSDLNRTRIANLEGRTFELDQPLQNRERYVLENVPNNGIADPKEDMRRYLVTEENPSPEMTEFLKTVRGTDASQTVNNLLKYYRENGYSYTLNPPKSNSLDEFFFKKKAGFCEHYAGSMATMLRYMKIPARVVVGFQGGTPSFLENYITVRAHDAHAWVEYFEPQAKRWRRVDPTAQIAPQEIGGGNFAANGGRNYLLRFRALMDEIEANWIGFLLRFDLAAQKELLKKFGMEETIFRALPFFLALALVLILAIIYFIEAQRRVSMSKEDRLFRDLLTALRRFKIERDLSDGPLRLMEKVRQKSSILEAAVEPILTKIVWVRYAGYGLSTPEADQLKKDIRRLKKLSIK
jgi:transglutaminase-like putative cysteine protease